MALYRKYRPATFAEVVGQSHVTEPLSVALDSGRINHAYLFSGPRGCGKTSSARILARSLNCVEGPTSTPCGVCESCVSLAPGGPGNLDVTELDAATHNGVDDMRELRERAFYAPAESRYRVFIIDEAHMISTAGFNALLKIVEEPPEHLIFIFATTEPEKLLQTIRSRTHNYPFRLLAPPDMRGLLESVVSGEGVPVEDAVYPLVIRAGGGSPRDSLSIMDQLLAGAGPEGVTYNRALALLGVTDSSLIDRAVDALAEHDSAALFAVVDEVIDAGYDPRRFGEDLLDRFRDLLVVQAVPDAFDRGLVNAPEESRDVLREQAEKMGQATLTRCASLVNEGLAQMRGATAPRLLLEILCARMALPAAGMTVEALAQRVEALEKGHGAAGTGTGVGSSSGTGVRGSRAEMFARRRKTAEPENSAEQEPPAIAEARRARDIMQRHRQASAAEATATNAAAAESAAKEASPKSVAQEAAKQTSTKSAAQESAAQEAAVQEAAAQAPETPNQTEPAGIDSDSWARIMDAIYEQDLSAWIALRGATPRKTQPTPGELHVDHHTGSLARLVSGQKNAEIYSQAIEATTGNPAHIVVYVGGEAVGGEAPGKAEPAAAQPSAGEGQSPASTPTNPVPAETPVDPAETRSAASSALERARAMEEAMRKASHSHRGAGAAANPAPAAADSQEDPNSGWRARAERAKARKKYNMDNGFNGVPLPDEPPADPYGDGPVDNWDGGMASQAAANTAANSEAANTAAADPAAGTAADVPLPPEPANDFADGPMGGSANGPAPGQRPGQSPDGPPPGGPTPTAPGQGENRQPRGGMGAGGDEGASIRKEQRERDELLADLERAPGQRDHRTPLEIAGELIEKSLGAERVR
ncbi:DNA polymerase III subunit gamma and tau [uncultured Corynebacterium sp.]|uniref:DNA polymerase III subunit gamma and tau n=1 Tax=uncultured Corynebacterium sp. TaxID=159447 RepID=UPI0025CDC58F|nr:DNA polymerase III subunit gamma and tau [uncultured Corynebacterium sp.]